MPHDQREGRLRRHIPSVPTALSLLAVFIALGGTALAATGQLVNIADGTRSAYLAKVSHLGSLQTDAVPAAASRPFSVSVDLRNFYEGYDFVRLMPTSAKIAIDRIVVANVPENPDDWHLILWYSSIPSGGTCGGAPFSTWKRFASYEIPQDGTVTESLASPLVFAPPSGGQWCLIASAYTNEGQAAANDGDIHLTLGGWVFYGSYPPSTIAARGQEVAGDGPRSPEGP